ncbi:MAG: GyrI-like domain-containing protein [Pseudomonadota bacterium]
MPLIETIPETVTFAAAHFVYVEVNGDFVENAPLAWKLFHSLTHGKFTEDQIVGFLGLGKIDYEKEGDEAFIYQAGIMLKAKPAQLSDRLRYKSISRSNYASFTLLGSYSQLADTYPEIFMILDKTKLKIRSDFCIERYLNDPAEVPEDQLKTEILIPIL